MNATATWYNAERVSQPGSTILSAWKAEREAARAGQSPQASVPVSSITRGTEMFDILTGGFGMMGAGVPVTEQTGAIATRVTSGGFSTSRPGKTGRLPAPGRSPRSRSP